jgi:protein tyrosine/serine phosphatase
VWLLDSEDPADNPNLELVAEQTIDLLSSLRAEGRTVYLHCVDGGARTAFIAALYGARIEDVPATKVWPQIQEVLPHARLNTLFERVLRSYG